MLLSLASNANAQGPSFPDMVGIGSDPTGSAISFFYPYNAAITPQTFPAATGGTAPLEYSLTLPDNLRFDPFTRIMSGTPVVSGGIPITYTVTDSTAPAGLTDTIGLRLNICELPGGDATGLVFCVVPSGSSVTALSIASPPMDMNYVANTPVDVTLPEATGGTGTTPARLYSLVEANGAALPAGLTFDGDTRVLSGTPEDAGTTAVRYRVGEVATGDDEDEAVYYDFNIIVVANLVPVFTNATAFDTPIEVAENQTAVRGADYFGASDTPTGNLVLSGADASLFTLSATGTLTFNDAPNFEMPRGMAFSGGTNNNNFPLTVSATNSANTTTANFTVRVTDANDAPVFPSFVPPAFTEYSAGTFTFSVTDEDSPAQTLTYSFAGADHGAAITGNTFTWTPGEDDGGVLRTFRVSVTDSGTPPMRVTRTFTVIPEELPNRAPTGATITAAAMLTSPNTLALEAFAMDADTGTTLTYIWAVTTSEGGTIAPTTGTSVTYTPPTLATGDTARMIVITLTVFDDGTPPLTTTATHTVTVNPPLPADTAPSFGTATIAAQSFTTGTAVALTLPAATSGNPPYIYTLTRAADGSAANLPTGLTFDATATPPTITGTPTATLAATNFAYKATDTDANNDISDEAALSFSITVMEAQVMATGFTLSVVRHPGSTAVSTVLEGTTRAVRATATPTPAGSVFAADQEVTFTITPPPASRPDSLADPYVSYTAVAPRTSALAVGAANAGTSFFLRPTNDAFDHADFPLTITATASPSGAIGTATVTLRDNDIRITTSAASASVVAGATATYDVQLSEQPPAATTVTVASQGAGTATVSPATLTFTTGNWNTPQTVTVTGVSGGSTTIRHTAPTANGYDFVTNVVAVTVTVPDTAPSFGTATIADAPGYRHP